MSETITNQLHDINTQHRHGFSSHENKSCEKFSLSSAESLLSDISNINTFLSSGAIERELMWPLMDEMQEKIDNLKVLISCVHEGRLQDH